VTEDQAISVVTHLICRNRHIDPSQVLPSTDLKEELSFDSLDAAELLAALHKETGRQLDVHSMAELLTVRDIAKNLIGTQSRNAKGSGGE
jgi:acyl carrier protein